MMSAVRHHAGGLAASVFAVPFVMLFDSAATAAPLFASPANTVDEPGVPGATGSVMFAFSIAAVFVIAAIVTLKVRKNRHW